MKFPTYEVVLSHPDSDEPDEQFEVYSDLMLDEAEVLSSKTKEQYTWREWLVGVDNKEPDALRFMYWLARKRAGNPLECKFSEITFWMHAISVQVADLGDFGELDDGPIVLDGPDPTEGVETDSD